IDVPASLATIEEGPFRMHGLAFSGDRDISRVEVTTDGGQTWHDATLRPALSPFTWVLWHYDWNARAQEGLIKVMARATDGPGEVQTAKRTDPDPDGATGYPIVFVRVRRSAI
ncbi:MAG: molybdopterin-binding oxidoreductase, partial [Dehalococcoidia bacterium]